MQVETIVGVIFGIEAVVLCCLGLRRRNEDGKRALLLAGFFVMFVGIIAIRSAHLVSGTAGGLLLFLALIPLGPLYPKYLIGSPRNEAYWKSRGKG